MRYTMNPDGTLENVVTDVQSSDIREVLAKYGTEELDSDMLDRMATYDTHKLFK